MKKSKTGSPQDVPERSCFIETMGAQGYGAQLICRPDYR